MIIRVYIFRLLLYPLCRSCWAFPRGFWLNAGWCITKTKKSTLVPYNKLRNCINPTLNSDHLKTVLNHKKHCDNVLNDCKMNPKFMLATTTTENNLSSSLFNYFKIDLNYLLCFQD